MRESVIYQDIIQEGEDKGIQKGREEEGRSLILRLLTRRVGEFPKTWRDRISDSVPEAIALTPFP